MAATNTSPDVNVTFCVRLPPTVNSDGIFSIDEGKHIMDYILPRLELEIVLIYVIGQAFHFLLKRAATPIFVSHMIAGLIVGVVMQKVIPKNDVGEISSSESNAIVLGSMATFGYSLYMFQNGMKMNLGMIKKAGSTAIGVGILSVVIPLLILTIFHFEDILSTSTNKSFFIAATYSFTSFPAIADLLRHLKIINSELGRLALSVALVGDLVSLVLFIANAFLKIWIELDILILKDIIFLASFIAVIVFVLRPAMYWIVRNTPEGRPVKELYVYLVILAFFITLFLTKEFGQLLLFGPFIFGLVVPNGAPLGSALEEILDPMISGLFLPLFVASATMRITSFHLPSINADKQWLFVNGLLFLVLLVSKFAVSMGFSLYGKMPKYDALAFSFIMCSKGIVELGWYGLLSDGNLMKSSLYMLLVFIIMGIAVLVPISVRILYDPKRKYAGYRKRNIMNSIEYSELSIVACIHVPNNVTAIINLLDVSSPTSDPPIFLNVLHLVKLSAQSSPIFITHQLEQHAPPSNNSYSENFIFSFKQFEHKHNSDVTVGAFTAISPDDMMDEDVCTLALDKYASFIILPFHRKWYINGSIESDDHTIMALNWSVFERTPCSVGVLVDRSQVRRPNLIDTPANQSSQNILMVFLGGADDREALTFAKRMAQDTKVKLTVLNIYSNTTHCGDSTATGWERILDFEVLKSVKNNASVKYIEEEVNDGHILASMLREVVNEYQLMIVGRRFGVDCPQTSGLKQWSEFQELGVIGDLLASTDFYSRCSVLIVQQQITFENIK